MMSGKKEKYSVESYEKLQSISTYKVRNNTEFLEKKRLSDADWNNVPKNKSFSGSLSNELLGSERLKDKYCDDLQDNGKYTEKSKMNLVEDEGIGIRSAKHLFEQMSLEKSSRNRRSQSYKISGDNKSHRRPNLERAASEPAEPALDEIAIQAMVSILSGYVRRFVKDESFRASLCQSCISCLSFTNSKELDYDESGVIVNFKQAIEAVERVAEELGSPKELKKASLQLSVIAGLNSNDLKDGFTSGIPNSHLAACAHLYLSVIYKLQKKDKVSAKYLLQVFCDSPFQARKFLLPDLWDQLFLPHLSHLRVWYDQEAEAIPNTSSRARKMKLLEKVYNEILDSGTYQFAVYYKEWLTAGIEAPTVPSIYVPTTSVSGVSQGGSQGPSPDPESSPVASVTSQPMISKRLYEAVFGHSNKIGGSNDVNVEEGEECFNTCARSFDDTVEDSRMETIPEKHMQEYAAKNLPDDAPLHADGLLMIPANAWELRQIAIEEVKELKEESAVIEYRQNMLSHSMANEVTLKKLAKSVFQLQQTRDSSDSVAAGPLMHSKCMPMHDLYNSQSNTRSCEKCEFKKIWLASHAMSTELSVTNYSAGPFMNYDDFEESSFFSSTPKDFICPLTGELFEDPVTLETGQTFERKAIKEWLDRGNRTCPATGKTLGRVEVPVTNFILKRVINGWKSEHCKNLLVYATQMAGSSINHEYRSKDEAAILILEKLLTDFNAAERMENAKYLISLGGLHFLVRRFELGNLEEKTHVAMLLSCCIKADGGCRNFIARNIKKSCLVELLHSKQANSRTNAVMLLTELICLNRRTIVTSFLSGLRDEGLMNSLHVLLVYLQSSPPKQKPLVAVLLLHFDLMAEPRKYSIYREEAVDAIIASLECSLTDEKVRDQSCRALFILGGQFTYSGEICSESWLLKHAGFYDGSEAHTLHNDDETQTEGIIPEEEEEKAREEWLKNLSVLLLGNGKKSFLECISKCLGSEDSFLVRACLTMVAWLSHALASISDAEFQLSAFSFLIPRLKQNLENERIEHRILASLCLFNFSKISECRVLLMTFADEIMVSLRNLAEVTWTAEELCSIFSNDSL